MLAFLLSLVLVAVNIGQIITILVPLINSHASPDHNYRKHDMNHRMKCGYGSEVTAVSNIYTVNPRSLNLISVGASVDHFDPIRIDRLFHYKTVYYSNKGPGRKSQERQSAHGDP